MKPGADRAKLSAPGLKIVKKRRSKSMNKWNTLIFAVSAIFTVASTAVAVYLFI